MGALLAAREKLAKLAEEDKEFIFAREVRAGCWDHRNDCQQFKKEFEEQSE